MELKGIYTALVTPFKNYDVDEEALERLIDFQLKSKVDGLVPCGTTGEAATLSYEEHEKVVELTVKHVKGTVPVVAGTGSNSTKETIELSQSAKNVGADMCLLTTPYYNKPTQEGLYQHYKKVAEEVDIPIILYNIPGRTGINMNPDTIARLAQIPNIVGIKEASGSLVQVAEIYRLAKERITIMSGDDNLFLPMMSVGARGVISVLSNAMPVELQALYQAFLGEKDMQKAMDMNTSLLPIMQAMFVETNPIPIKETLYHMGMMEKEFRLPLCPLSEGSSKFLKGVLREYGLLKRE
ncbi:MAG TPA: 4-hydroxy-tetrahydrodipicolinate synthase [Syntrophorhabdus sp.]|jgi:4-hydroxy-tetrahydrodipicolinate synthase|nr:4-hydroxy-tetrahydrodipicolinate synthase [Syntrophorhabdus sp.]HNY70592.1 4-hydroxy-tetrahydrodipicolinate synthase [Syntrophorhabdus sp.]HOD77506.1 4-hydroxy-tetrahydrodipicolinate synthase [Syntrophorhabdus sp.]HPB36797.1 4-hydroxy-tetrahydrodipicolinate synthase [Syntrophorhabdus sp.]